jgi:hypothetical protein
MSRPKERIRMSRTDDRSRFVGGWRLAGTHRQDVRLQRLELRDARIQAVEAQFPARARDDGLPCYGRGDIHPAQDDQTITT